jgi:hypothetical protein
MQLLTKTNSTRSDEYTTTKKRKQVTEKGLEVQSTATNRVGATSHTLLTVVGQSLSTSKHKDKWTKIVLHIQITNTNHLHTEIMDYKSRETAQVRD